MLQKTIYLNSEAQTHFLGSLFFRFLKPGMKIYLYGNLGAGKTTLTRTILKAAGYQGHVKSPTYALMEHYTIDIDNALTELIHFDLFRLETPDEFIEAGFSEYFDGNTICIVEWPEKAKAVLPPADIEVFFLINHTQRELKLLGQTESGKKAINQIYAEIHGQLNAK